MEDYELITIRTKSLYVSNHLSEQVTTSFRYTSLASYAFNEFRISTKHKILDEKYGDYKLSYVEFFPPSETSETSLLPNKISGSIQNLSPSGIITSSGSRSDVPSLAYTHGSFILHST